MMGQTCGRCGLEYPDSYRFCHLCGTVIQDLEADGTSGAAVAVSRRAIVASRINETGGKIVSFMLGIILLSLATLVIVIHLTARASAGEWNLSPELEVLKLGLWGGLFICGLVMLWKSLER